MINQILTILISFFAVYIPYQQWQTNERKRRQDLFKMRYDNLYKHIFDMLNDFDYYMVSIKSGSFDHGEFIDKEIKNAEKFNKYSFLIKSKDFEGLSKAFDNIKAHTANFDRMPFGEKAESSGKYFKIQRELRTQICSILEPYLRIESEITFWLLLNKIKNCFYEFFEIEEIKDFLSSQAKNSVILNLFQDLTGGKNSSIENQDGEIPNQVLNDEENDSRLVVSE